MLLCLLCLFHRAQVPELQPEYYGLNLDSNELYSTKGTTFSYDNQHNYVNDKFISFIQL